MAEVTLRLRVDPQTGRKVVVVDYHSDADALPMEHEEDHRAIVDQLIAAGALSEDDRGSVVIERGADRHPGAEVSEDAPAAPQGVRAGDEAG